MKTTIVQSNGSKFLGELPDEVNALIKTLTAYTLNPTFEKFGNFIQAPDEIQWIKGKCPEEFEGMTHFWGNFYDLSHVFSIYSNDEAVITELSKLIRENQATDKYKAAKIITEKSDKERESYYLNLGK